MCIRDRLESVEEVRRSLLTALIDRKINKAIGSIEGVVKKLEDVYKRQGEKIMGKTVTFDYSKVADFVSAEELANFKSTVMGRCV